MSANDGNDELRRMRAGAVAPDLPAPPSPFGPDHPGGDDDGVPPEPESQLPDDCPVIPLGVSGEMCHYLDQLTQYREVKAKDHSRLNIQSLFGTRTQLLYDTWPRRKLVKNRFGEEEWEVTGWKPELAAEALMHGCAMKGPWSAIDKLRGGGAWRGRDGELILHVGDALIVAPATEPRDARAARWAEETPGLYDDKVYPAQSRLQRPHPVAQSTGTAEAAGKAILKTLSTWAWRRPEIDPYILLGWHAASRLAGAIKWRPVGWLTGRKGGGKSGLLEYLTDLSGEGGMLTTPDPTPAAIRQIQKHASLPIAIDEGEAAESNDRMNALIKLARDAATGAIAIRGGSDHNASQFQLRSCMLFSSILIPPLMPQDRSRIAILDLKKLPQDAKPPKRNERERAELGARLLRHLVDQWHRAQDTIELYRDAMRELGLDARSQDVYGTLLGCADLALYDRLPDTDSLAAWQLKLRTWVVAEQNSNDDDSMACLNHLLTSALESSGSDRKRDTVGGWIHTCLGIAVPGERDIPTDNERRRAKATLAANGLAVIRRKLDTQEVRQYLAVPNRHVQLGKLFDRTIWGGRSGADGVWRQSLARLVEDRPMLIGFQVHIGGANGRCTLLPIELTMPTKEGPAGDDRDISASRPAEAQPSLQDAARESTPAPATDVPERPGRDTAFSPPLPREDDYGADRPAPGPDDAEEEARGDDDGGLDVPL